MRLDACAPGSRCGGKSEALGAALRAGLPVPPGVALSVDDVTRIVATQRLDESVAAEVAGLGLPVAVRSSALGEDGADDSFAGQHLTALNAVTTDAVLAAVVDVHASATTESALAYRRSLGIDGAPAIAVLVQQLLAPDVAGVLFTRAGDDGRRVVEASWGLGQAVVDGAVIPDHFELADDGTTIEATPGEKDVEFVAEPSGGVVEREVTGDRVTAPTLDAAQLAQLNALAADCERVFEAPQDVEWAFAGGRLYLLQSRPITRRV